MPISYRDAGVDIDAGEELVSRIGPLARATRTAQVIGDVGGFAGMCKLPDGMRSPLLVSGTDGVGTKLKVAFATGVHDTVGVDLVAMCVNDIICCGAEPLFFLDYFATASLNVDVAESVVRGIADGCKQAGCALLGGETAELPGMYADGEYDLAGFAVGVVERDAVLQPSRVQRGDALVALGSSGVHSNGLSLARRVLLDAMGLGFDAVVDGLGCSVGEALLVPTRIYASACKALGDTLGEGLHGLSHITGGGLVGNLPRCLPDGMGARLLPWERPRLFSVIAEGGPVTEAEMRRTFNLGVGMVAVVAKERAEDAIAAARGAGDHAWLLGEVTEASDERVVFA